MKKYYNHFDDLDFFESNFANLVIDKSSIEITAHNLGVFPEHPLRQVNPDCLSLSNVNLIFENVKKSERSVIEFIDGLRNNGFEPEYTVVDGPFESLLRQPKTYYVEGLLLKPLAWISWTIECEVFYLEV